MAITNQELFNIFLANPNMSDAQIATLMQENGISPAQVAKTFNMPEGEVAARVAATLPPNQAVLLGDTYVQAVNQVTGSGDSEQIGGLQNVITYKASENQAGGGYTQYTPTGEVERTGVQKEVASFTGGLIDMLEDPVVLAALLTVAGGAGAFDGLLGGAGTGATTGAELLGATTGTEAATAFELANAGVAGGTASFTPAQLALIESGATAAEVAAAGATTIAPAGVDYSLTGSTPTTPTTNMGGAQGLQGGTSANLPTMGGGQGITLNVGAPSTTLADAIATIGGAGPSNLVTMGGGQGLTLQTPTGLVTSTGTIPIGGLTGVNNVIGQTGINTATNIGSTIGTTIPTTVIPPTVVTPPVVPPTPPVTPPTPPTVPPTTPVVPPVVPPTISDVIKTIGTVATVASLVNAVNPPTVTPSTTGFDIVPVPADFKTPPKPTTAPYTPLTPIDFGTRELLRGTQFERFLDPNYGQVPEPVQYSQPSNLSYNDLMSILGSRQGMPPASSLSINDIISGIQNQYGQTPTSTMG